MARDDLSIDGMNKIVGWAGVILGTCLCAAAMAETRCLVLDPELQEGYEGGCHAGFAEGKGRAWGTGTYEGEFLQGKKHGYGVKFMANGDRYVGQFAEDLRDGVGEYVWGGNVPWAGERYLGDYRNDKRDGWGTYLWPSGDRYEGPWKGDIRQGGSALEVQRFRYRQAMVAWLKPGLQTCGVGRLGLATPVEVRGVVESVTPPFWTIRVTEVVGYPGDSVNSEQVDWRPCASSGATPTK